jgi:DNA-nicking Smr family endonuclease
VSRRELSDEEHELWRGIARSVKPLRKRTARKADDAKPAVATPAKVAKVAKVAKSAKPARVATPPAKVPAPPRLAPLARREKQQVARGRVAIDKRIDLHGLTQAEAHAALGHFLRRAQHDGARFVLVITGKGGRASDTERGVLRRQVPHWLGLPELRDIVLGFEEAHVAHGGEGALYVRLRKLR